MKIDKWKKLQTVRWVQENNIHFKSIQLLTVPWRAPVRWSFFGFRSFQLQSRIVLHPLGDDRLGIHLHSHFHLDTESPATESTYDIISLVSGTSFVRKFIEIPSIIHEFEQLYLKSNLCSSFSSEEYDPSTILNESIRSRFFGNNSRNLWNLVSYEKARDFAVPSDWNFRRHSPEQLSIRMTWNVKKFILVRVFSCFLMKRFWYHVNMRWSEFSPWRLQWSIHISDLSLHFVQYFEFSNGLWNRWSVLL